MRNLDKIYANAVKHISFLQFQVFKLRFRDCLSSNFETKFFTTQVGAPIESETKKRLTVPSLAFLEAARLFLGAGDDVIALLVMVWAKTQDCNC